MPRLSIADCEALLRIIEERPSQRPSDLRVMTRLRQRVEQARPASAPSKESPPEMSASHPNARPSVLHVCVSCREPGSPREPREERPGFKLYQQLRDLFHESPLGQHVDVQPAQCLSVCPRPCGIALSSPGAWSYLFGDQRLGQSVREIMACVSLYIESADGLMPRKLRPQGLRASILGRVPPSGMER
ncbi:MAG: DUF1636 domain-containing protein [Myxococcota bacterium]